MPGTLIIALIAANSAPQAAIVPAVDNYAVEAIAARQNARALALLEAGVRDRPEDESAAINLAVVYARLGRHAEARAMYERVLTLPDVDVEAVDGSMISSRAIARAWLAQLRIAAR